MDPIQQAVDDIVAQAGEHGVSPEFLRASLSAVYDRGRVEAQAEHENGSRGLGDAIEEMTSWWAGLAAQDAERTVPKALAYGAHDLDVMAWAIDPMLPTIEGETPELRHRRGLETAVWFYVLGKVARIQAATLAGANSDDHWFDAGVYVLMARRIRETGRWP